MAATTERCKGIWQSLSASPWQYSLAFTLWCIEVSAVIKDTKRSCSILLRSGAKNSRVKLTFQTAASSGVAVICSSGLDTFMVIWGPLPRFKATKPESAAYAPDSDARSSSANGIRTLRRARSAINGRTRALGQRCRPRSGRQRRSAPALQARW